MKTNRKTGSTQKPKHYVGIGASAGGLEAIELFFKNMETTSGLAFIVVQHLSPDYKSLMVELLSKKTAMPVHRAEEGMEVLANNVYLIPPKKNLTIFHGKLLLNDKVIKQGINLPIDIFLKSLAEDQANNSIAIILSGTGSDGTRGVRAIKELGGMVMVQEEGSAKFDGMPRSAISTGVADFILAPEQMPEQLLAYVAHPYVTGEKQSDLLLQDADALTRLFAELRDKVKVDFTHYKPTTVTRRIERRMSVNQINDFEKYVEYLQNFPGEVTALYRDLLIGVTNFFRDPKAMHELGEKWLPELLQGSNNREIRFWVAGCSTGEEAYTLAILVKEAMEKSAISRDIKIFATDIDKDALVSASTGIYPESIIGDLNPKIVAKYFYHKEEKLQIARHLREMVVFAQHNVIKDPPFTNIDLISCRNLLIYLQPVLQQKAFEMFNFSLNPGGLLFLGTSESIGEMKECFTSVHHKHKIYRSKGKPQPLQSGFISQTREDKTYSTQPFTNRGRDRRVADNEGNRIVKQYLEIATQYYLPHSVIANENLELVHIVGDTEGYFKIPSGPAEYNITKMAVPELAIPLSTGVQKVFRTGEPLHYTNIRLQRAQGARTVRIRIIPLPGKKGFDPLVAIFFEEIDSRPTIGIEEATCYDVGEEAQQRIADLEQELQFARENLQATIEELETSNEELQATNEELLASNEELQSTNEELQSTNEELYTVNAEHQTKIIELTELNNDVDNLLTSSRIGTLLLDENMEIRRFSPEIVNIFHVMEKDIGRPLHHVAHRLSNIDLTEKIKNVLQTNQMIEQELESSSGRYYLARIIPYAIGPNAYSGIVLTFIDITETKAIRDHLAHSRQTTLDISQYMPSGLFVYQQNDKGELLLEKSNPEAERMTGIRLEKYRGKRFEEVWPATDRDGLVDKLHTVMATGETCYLENYEYKDDKLEGAYRIHIFRLPEKRLAVSFEDISEQQRMSRDLEEGERKYRKLFETMAQGVVYQDCDGKIISANPAAEKILGLTSDQMHGIDSMDPRWQAIAEDGSVLPGEKHPAMVALSTCQPVFGFIMGVYSPAFSATRWILVNSSPQFHHNEQQPYQVYSTFEDITDRYCLLADCTKTKRHK
ncbi:chemotaxis protein CheB [Desulfogranum marinum]|uniref:chemotaxis protein CheB n=1 Tax=Desulfogranum marinum TaxID=453220 RepID=UPI0019650AC3|nr:chemotaxis protein CheB [Desulfogranum marinum]MBM9512185.1 PAS domain-containing protein [Desulfogranum marinum]